MKWINRIGIAATTFLVSLGSILKSKVETALVKSNVLQGSKYVYKESGFTQEVVTTYPFGHLGTILIIIGVVLISAYILIKVSPSIVKFLGDKYD